MIRKVKTDRVKPDVYRDPEQIESGLRKQINDLNTAKAGWPLFLCGEEGSGKSCAALCLLDYAGSGIYQIMSDLHDDLVRAKNNNLYSKVFPYNPISERQIWSRIEKTKLYVLDEIGLRINVSDTHFEALKKVLDVRENKPLVIISNMNLTQIAKNYHPCVASRLSAGTVFESTGDRRLERKLKIAEA